MELLHIRSDDADCGIFPTYPKDHFFRMGLQTHNLSGIRTKLRHLSHAYVHPHTGVRMGKIMGNGYSAYHDICRRNHIYNWNNNHTSDFIRAQEQISHRVKESVSNHAKTYSRKRHCIHRNDVFRHFHSMS